MGESFASWAGRIEQLAAALRNLADEAAPLGVPRPHGEEWHQLLHYKLLPQLRGRPCLIVAVVGGTNIGKSVVFNHLAGSNASHAGPLAAGTKHPVCLVPADFDQPDTLAEWFEGFHLRPWHSAEDATEESPEHRLFWRPDPAVPPRLLLLDTPDIDSNAEVNWQRADHLRQAADVLIGVLTEQKYNDAAVKRFFRKAVDADKPILVLFNQVDLEADREYWPLWLETFCRETGARPELVYVVPRDRAAAAALRLPFYPVGSDGRAQPSQSVSLREELSHLHFDRIKIRTFRGALRQVVAAPGGAADWLQRVREASGQFALAGEALSGTRFARIQWPALPPRVMIDELAAWWDERRNAWSRGVHAFYRQVGRGITWPFRTAWSQWSAAAPEPLEDFQHREREAVIAAVARLIDELERLAEIGNDLLRSRLEALLEGNRRAALVAAVQASHAQLPQVSDDFRRFIRRELDTWSQHNPRALRWLRSLDHLAAVARPAISVTLVISGWMVAGQIVHDAAVQAVGHSVGQWAAEAAITGGIAGGGEAAVTGAGATVQRAAAQFLQRVQTRYAEMRAGWLAAWLERELLGELLADLRRGATMPQSEAFLRVEQVMDELRRQLPPAP